MEVTNTMGAAEVLRKYLLEADPDLVRSMVQTFAEALMSAEASGLCNAEYGERQRRAGELAQRLSRARRWDTRAGTIDLAIPKLRTGQLLPRLADRAPPPGRAGPRGRRRPVLRRRGLDPPGRRRRAAPWASRGSRSPRSQSWPSPSTSAVAAFRNRPLDAGPYTYVWLDALTQKVREGGRIVNVAVVIATGVNADGHREILGLDLITTEDGAGWTAFLRGLVARGLSASRWSSPTPTGAWSTPSPRCSPEQPGNAAGSTSCATC